MNSADIGDLFSYAGMLVCMVFHICFDTCDRRMRSSSFASLISITGRLSSGASLLVPSVRSPEEASAA